MRKLLSLLLPFILLPSCGKDVPSESPVSYSLVQSRSAKRGVSFSFATVPDMDIPLLGNAVSWSYDWSSRIPSQTILGLFGQYSMDWCPMAWNGNYDSSAIRAYKAANPKALYILAFNEPNLTDQANMTPAQAAALWPELKALAAELGMKLISPAMNYGTLAGYHDPVKWLDEFFAMDGVSPDDVDGIALHTYMPSAGAVRNFIGSFKKYGKPIWLTEFCNGDNNNISEDAQLAYMCETLSLLEQEPMVFRYAWFMPRGSFNARWNNSLLTSRPPIGLTRLGKVFVNFSTFDKAVYYKAGDVIPAEQYCASNGPLHCEPSTDGGILDLTNLTKEGSASYQLDIPSAGRYSLSLRYLTYMDSAVSLSVGGGAPVQVGLPNTAKAWKTASAEIDLPSGKSTLTLSGNSAASVSVNWLRISSK